MKGWFVLPVSLLLGQVPVLPDPPPAEDTFPTVEPGLQPGEASPAPPGATSPGEPFPLVEPGPGPDVEPEPDTGLGPGVEPSPGVRLGPEPGGDTRFIEPGAQQQVEPYEEQPFEQTPQELSAAQEMRLLRNRLQQLEAQFQAQEEQAQEEQAQTRLQAVEELQATQQARALELERLRQLRLANLERAYSWLTTADELLETGELDIGPALTSAAQALSIALDTAAETGRGQTVLLIERARDRIYIARQAAEERDVYIARRELEFAGFELRQAWRLALNRPDTANLTP